MSYVQWSPYITYQPGDGVSYETIIYLALSVNTNVVPLGNPGVWSPQGTSGGGISNPLTSNIQSNSFGLTSTNGMSLTVGAPGQPSSTIMSLPPATDFTIRHSTAPFETPFVATYSSINMTGAGTVTAPTVTPSTDNSTKVASTAFVQSVVSGGTSTITPVTLANPQVAKNVSSTSTTGLVVLDSSTGTNLRLSGNTISSTGSVVIDTPTIDAHTANLTANAFIKQGGTALQYLMADGSITTNSGNTGSSNIYLYNSINSSNAPPIPNGDIKYNSAVSQDATTILYISHLTRDGIDIDVFLAQINITSVIYLQDQNNSTNYIYYDVTGATTIIPNNYVSVPVLKATSAGTGSTSFGSGHNIIMSIFTNSVEVNNRLTTLETKTQNIDASTTVAGTTNFTGRIDMNVVGASNKINIGSNTGLSGQGNITVAIGNNAGRTNQGNSCIAIGNSAGMSNTSGRVYTIGIGASAGGSDQGNYGIGIGYQAGYISQGNSSIAIGNNAGSGALGTGQGISCIAIGNQAGSTAQNNNAVAIGNLSGNSGQLSNAVAIGTNAGQTSQGASSIAIGYLSGNSGQLANAVAIGTNAGQTSQGDSSVCIGKTTSAGTEGVAIGLNTTAGLNCVAIGSYSSAQSGQGNYAVNVGYSCGTTNQSQNALACGSLCGFTNQGSYATALGYYSGYSSQGPNSVAIGRSCGNASQGTNSIAIGNNCGTSIQAPYSIAIGNNCGTSNQPGNSIILNSQSSVTLNPTTSGLFVAPIRAFSTQANSGLLQYDSTTKEIYYAPNINTLQFSYTSTSGITTTNAYYFGNIDSVPSTGNTDSRHRIMSSFTGRITSVNVTNYQGTNGDTTNTTISILNNTTSVTQVITSTFNFNANRNQNFVLATPLSVTANDTLSMIIQLSNVTGAPLTSRMMCQATIQTP